MRHVRSNFSFCLLGFICFLSVRLLHEHVLSPSFDLETEGERNKGKGTAKGKPGLVYRSKAMVDTREKQINYDNPMDGEDENRDWIVEGHFLPFPSDAVSAPLIQSRGQSANSDKVWLINEPSACQKKPTMLLGVAAAVYAFERREIIRQTWGTYSETENVKLLFFVGDNGDPAINEALAKESIENHDIIQENYVESYWNLTRKTVGQIKWKKKFCPETEILAHLDDDVFIDVPKILEALQNQRYTKMNAWVGCMWKMGRAPVRRTGKYAVTEEEFVPSNYPASCNGPCYFISREANDKLVEESFKHNEFKLEDMYVTGILRDEQSIPIFPIPRGNLLCQHLGKKNIMHSNVEYTEATVEERMMKAWETYGPGGPEN